MDLALTTYLSVDIKLTINDSSATTVDHIFGLKSDFKLIGKNSNLTTPSEALFLVIKVTFITFAEVPHHKFCTKSSCSNDQSFSIVKYSWFWR